MSDQYSEQQKEVLELLKLLHNKGLYTVTRTDEQGRENKCLLINGDGRDLSFIPSNSIDALITVIYTSLVGCSLGSLRS